MAFKNPSPVTESTLELRLTTTMTGGVSLAIWMAVVAREINLLAQASQWRSARGTCSTHSRLTKESATSLKPYAELIDLLDMVVDVDILSGTSARGINAALLASPRVTRSDLGVPRDLGPDLGALTDLLRDPRDRNTLGPEKGDVCTLLKVPRHDDAYALTQRRVVSVNNATGGNEIRAEEAINSRLPELTRAAKTAEHLLFEHVSDIDLTKTTAAMKNSPSDYSLSGGSQVVQAVSQVTNVILSFAWGKMIVQLVVWISVAGEPKWLTAVMVPWSVHVSEQLKGSSCHNT
jgi:hypothetical protein